MTADPPVRQDRGGQDHDDPGGPAAGRRASAGVRFLDALAGLLAAGILVVGLVLLLALLFGSADRHAAETASPAPQSHMAAADRM